MTHDDGDDVQRRQRWRLAGRLMRPANVVVVQLYPGEPAASMLKMLKRGMQRTNTAHEVKRRAAFQKPSERRRTKSRTARAKARKAQRKAMAREARYEQQGGR